MEIRTQKAKGSYILYDAQAADQVAAHTFDLDGWRARGGLLAGSDQGRAAAWFVRDASGQEYVWRHYRRGGLPGRLIADRYLYLGLARSRPWREFHLTAELFEAGLPVPRPFAARLLRHGPSYSADLITCRLPAVPLSARLAEGALDQTQWRRIGRVLARFHAHGLDHADLNAHNILLGDEGAVYLIDLDRGRLRRPGGWAQANLARLRRSFDKLRGRNPAFAFDEAAWQTLISGYQQGWQDD